MFKTAIVFASIAAASRSVTAQPQAGSCIDPNTNNPNSYDPSCYFALREQVSTQNAALAAQLSSARATISMMQAQLSQQSIEANLVQSATLATISAKKDQIVERLSIQTSVEDNRILTISDLSQQVANEVRRGSTLVQDITRNTTNTVRSHTNQVSTVVANFGQDMSRQRTSSNQLLSQTAASTASLVSRQINALNSSLARSIGPLGQVRAALSTSHFMTPSVPVFRWHMFHVYSNNGIGWFDGNNPRFFGGRHPSQWGDGNTNVWDMHHDWRYMSRIFTRRGVGTTSGATVCSETWYLYSSTDTKYCLALWRIKNTGSQNIGWRVNWYGTGWSGWGNLQTASINGAGNFRSSCTWWCHRAYTFTVPANRVSTIIFANGMTHPNHYSDNHHIETTFLGFDGLSLPRGLEYVDDLAAVGNGGRWR